MPVHINIHIPIHTHVCIHRGRARARARAYKHTPVKILARNLGMLHTDVPLLPYSIYFVSPYLIGREEAVPLLQPEGFRDHLSVLVRQQLMHACLKFLITLSEEPLLPGVWLCRVPHPR
jgi:hypothetical protein